MAKKIQSLISINEKENWGNLANPRQHIAAVGARLADNRRREFGVFGNRITVIGQEDVAKRLHKFLFSKKTLNKIAKVSHFVWGCETYENCITGIALGKHYEVSIYICCRGEYCYVQAYADKVEKLED